MDVRGKLVELLQDENNPVWRWFPNNMAMMKLADYLISNGVTVQEWISVDDRLPDKKGAFLVYVKTKNKWGGYIKTTWFTTCYEGVEDHMQGKKIWYDYDSDFGDYEVRNVTHWMPLPDPPKENDYD